MQDICNATHIFETLIDTLNIACIYLLVKQYVFRWISLGAAQITRGHHLNSVQSNFVHATRLKPIQLLNKKKSHTEFWWFVIVSHIWHSPQLSTILTHMWIRPKAAWTMSKRASVTELRFYMAACDCWSVDANNIGIFVLWLTWIHSRNSKINRSKDVLSNKYERTFAFVSRRYRNNCKVSYKYVCSWFIQSRRAFTHSLSRSLIVLIVFRDLIENTNAPKHQKISPSEHVQLVDLLITKDKEFRSVLQLAGEQEKIEEKMTMVKAQVDVQVGSCRHIGSVCTAE